MNSIKNILILFSLLIFSCYEPKEKPDDFDQFWDDTLTELGTTVRYEVIKDSIVEDQKWTLNKIKSFQDVSFYAWVAEPLGDGEYPVKIKFSGFGRGNNSVSNIPHKWFLKNEESINMVVDIRGQGLSTEQIQFKGYLTKGLTDKNNYVYRGAYMDAVKSVDFIAEHPKSDGNIIVTGGSQGGALSIVATALNPKVTMSIIGFPFLTDMYHYDRGKWPMNILLRESNKKEIDLDDLLETLSYFDIINFAEKIDTPVFLRTQEIDTITPKEGAIKFFERIKSDKKEIYIENCEGHGCSSKSEVADKLERAFIKSNIQSH
nr:acetylxylan esterase [uncultured Psychroserpens sp.]